MASCVFVYEGDTHSQLAQWWITKGSSKVPWVGILTASLPSLTDFSTQTVTFQEKQLADVICIFTVHS